jgi:RNA-binding protein
MDASTLTGREKTRLRGLGQKLSPSLKIGKAGLTPAFLAELQRQFRGTELVKLRLLGVERAGKEPLCDQIAAEGRCTSLGAIGHTALFYRRNADPARQTARAQE